VKDARLGLTRPARETPAYLLTLGHDQNMTLWKGSAGFQAQFLGPTKSVVPGEQWTRTDARILLDLYALARLTANLNLRLSMQNLLGADTDRDEQAWRVDDAWSLASHAQGARGWLLTLEGKW
jgi:iron complex outermembrane receptor protein